jgi:GAF domain-containing protein
VQQVEQALEAERRAYGSLSQSAWLDYARSLTHLGYLRDYSGLTPIPTITDQRTRQVLQSGQPMLDPADSTTLFMPVIVRRQVVGVLKLHKPDSSWLEDDIRLVETLSEQLGVALDSARSYQETQTNAQRDRLLSEIGGRVRQTLDIETILKTVPKSCARPLPLCVIVRLGTPLPPERCPG